MSNINTQDINTIKGSYVMYLRTLRRLNNGSENPVEEERLLSLHDKRIHYPYMIVEDPVGQAMIDFNYYCT